MDPISQSELAARAARARANIGVEEPVRPNPAFASWRPNEEQAARLLEFIRQAPTQAPPAQPDLLHQEYLKQAENMDPAARATFLRDVGMSNQSEEHAALAKFMTQQYGPLGALSMAVAAPVYAATKGVVQALPAPIAQQLPYWNSTPPSLGEIGSAYKGIWQGLTAPTNDQPIR